MNKEEAKVQIHNAFTAYAAGIWNVSDSKAKLYEIVDAIEPERQKVVLPKDVGKQWDKLVASQISDDRGVTATDYGLTKLARYNLNGDRFHELVEWWDHTSNSYETLINAAKYGWTPEPKRDKLYRVYVPETDQVYVYTHRVWSNRKVHLEVQELEEQSDDPTELFTMEQIQDLNLEDYEWEVVEDND